MSVEFTEFTYEITKDKVDLLLEDYFYLKGEDKWIHG